MIYLSKEIPLTQGKFAIVDEDDYKELSQYKWHFTRNGYAARRVGKDILYMHRVILNAPKGMIVDHINQSKLDNRRENIRLCTHKQNLRNRGNQVNNTTGYKGVSYGKEDGKWRAYLKCDGKMHHLGSHKTKESAALAYNRKAIEMFGEFACLNDIKGNTEGIQ